jgi:hypothetical protein
MFIPKRMYCFRSCAPGREFYFRQHGRDLELAGHDPVEEEACRGRPVAREYAEQPPTRKCGRKIKEVIHERRKAEALWLGP